MTYRDDTRKEKMDEKRRVKKKILHWVFLVVTACVLSIAVLLILMIPVIKGDVYYTNEGKQTVQNVQTDEEDFPPAPEEEPPTCILVELRNEDIFEKGYYVYHMEYFISEVANIGSDNEPGSGIEWKVYISDTMLSEKEIYALEKTEPVAINKGEVMIERGQWVYVLCNINAQTSDKPSASMFSITSLRDYA